MGHYSLIRGWIQIASGGFGDERDYYWKEYKNYRELADALKNRLAVSNSKYDEYVKESFYVHEGFDDTLFLFIGTSVKDYGRGIERFIQDTVKEFDRCWGLICFNEADHEIYPPEKIWIIKNGKIFESRVSSFDGLQCLLRFTKVFFVFGAWLWLRYYFLRYFLRQVVRRVVTYLRKI